MFDSSKIFSNCVGFGISLIAFISPFTGSKESCHGNQLKVGTLWLLRDSCFILSRIYDLSVKLIATQRDVYYLRPSCCAVGGRVSGYVRGKDV